MKKILVVDDDKDILNIVDLLLTRNNFIVKKISRWQRVSEAVKTFTPDLILLDIDLNGADGGDICKELKQSKETRAVPVILFSVLMPEDYLKKSGADGFLIKPFESAELLQLINHNLN